MNKNAQTPKNAARSLKIKSSNAGPPHPQLPCAIFIF